MSRSVGQDPEKAVEGGRFEAGLVASFNAPAAMVEDIVLNDGRIWTSDESTFAFYQAMLPGFGHAAGTR